MEHGPTMRLRRTNRRRAIYITCWDPGFQIVLKRSHAALIGKIGQDSLAFYIGSEFTFTASKDGILYLSSNDTPGFYFDNNGSLDAVISVID